MPLSLGLYRLFMAAFHRFAPNLLRARAAKGKEDPARLSERLGLASMPRPSGDLVWFHGVSVGESLSALPLIERLRRERPDLGVLITTATTTSAEILSRRLPEGVSHQYAPLDTPQAVTAFLDHWRPSPAIFIESDIWPILIAELSARRVPTALLSARITEKTARGWGHLSGAVRQLLDSYALIMAQDEASERRLVHAGSVRLNLGPRANLKTIGAPPPVDAAALKALQDLIGARRVALAASTHPGEEVLIAHALKAAMALGLLLVVAPRHPLRAADIRLDLEAMGFVVAQRSLNEPVTFETTVYLADTLGEMGLLYSVSELIVMGGSLTEGVGGHNPLEPARLSKSVITGPDISNWQAIYEDLFEAGAARRVQGPAELGFLSETLLEAPEALLDMHDRALTVAGRESDTLDRVWNALIPLLPCPRPSETQP